MNPEAVVFLRPGGASGLGHVGFGYDLLDARNWLVGAVENPQGGNQPAGQTGFWCQCVPNAETAMCNPTMFGAPRGTLAYSAAKIVVVAEPRLDAAHAKLTEWQNRPFDVFGGNCMNCTYDVLTAYGAVLPDPTQNPLIWAPNSWFNAIDGEVVPA
jgi:hypothetical protein